MLLQFQNNMDSPLWTRAISTVFSMTVMQGQELSAFLGAGSRLGSFQTRHL